MDNDTPNRISFNFARFIKFLEENNIIAVAIAAVLSERISEVTNSFVKDIIMPILNRDGDNDGERDIKKLEDAKIKIKGIEFGIGKFIYTIVKFFIIMYIIFIIMNIIKKAVRVRPISP